MHSRYSFRLLHIFMIEDDGITKEFIFYTGICLFIYSGHSSQGSQGRMTLFRIDIKKLIHFCFYFLHLLKKIFLFAYC